MCAMLDCSRNAVMHVDGLKKFIDTLSAMGYNALQLYTEDTYEIVEEPLFGYMRGRYTQEEIKETDAYAKTRGIELIPCIQTLGHLDQLFSWKRFQSVQDIYNILLVDEEETYRLIDRMFRTCAACFTSRKIHIGMDEAHMLGLGKYLDKHGYKKRSDILLEHLRKVCEIARKYGFTPMMWSDMFFKLAYGTEVTAAQEIPQEVIDKIPADMQLVYWDYMPTEKAHYTELLEKHKGFGRELWFAGCAKMGRTFHSQNEQFMQSLAASLAACKEAGVNNVMITIWGDYGNECATRATLPVLAQAALLYRGEDTDVKTYFEKIVGEKWENAMLCDMKMPDAFSKATPYSNGAKTMFYSDCLLGRYDSTVFGNGEERKAYTALAERFCEVEKTAKDKELFAFYRKLCEILALKYDLGYLTRKYYQAGEREKLKALIGDYERLIPMTEEFIEIFRASWEKENKPHGFDVIELRLGGTLQRLKTAMRKITAYGNGERGKIEELEEKLVYDEHDDLLNGKMSDVGNYPIIATVNRM